MGLTPASRSRVVALAPVPPRIEVITGVPEIERVVVSRDAEGNLVETPWVRPC